MVQDYSKEGQGSTENDNQQVSETAAESTATTESASGDGRPIYPLFIFFELEDLVWDYGRIAALLDDVFTNTPENPERNALFCAMQALKQQNRQTKALMDRTNVWLSSQATKKLFGVKSYDEIQREAWEAAQLGKEQNNSHPVQ
jgi:hypothetical protein